MGLGAPRTRTKISHDPNNTGWTRSTSGYGHTMLLSQGWTPGQRLGAIDAPHAHLQADASASYTRITPRGDNLGLGANRSSGQAAGECTGLDAFQGLLGRLNGKSDAILEKEQKSRDDLRHAIYTERRWGSTNFVRGGVLVGNHMQTLIEGEKLRLAAAAAAAEIQAGSGEQVATKARKRIRNKERSRAASAESISDNLPASAVTNADVPANDEDSQDPELSNDSEKARKRLRKEERSERRKKKAASRAGRAQQEDTSAALPPATSNEKDEARGAETRIAVAAPPVPTTTAAVGSRHAVRQRYIQQKRMAVMDARALREILMVKA